MTTASARYRPAGAAVGVVSLVLALSAIVVGLVAVPGGLVWLTLWVPGLGVPNEGLLSVLANLVTIPAALASWVLAVAGSVTAAMSLRLRSGGRSSRVALGLSAPGALLGTIAVVLVVAQLGDTVGVLPSSADARRHDDLQTVAAHLQLPTSKPELLARCEYRRGVSNQQRTLEVVEQWSRRRVNVIRSRLQDYDASFFSQRGAIDGKESYFTGRDRRGNSITVYLDRFPAGTNLGLPCARVSSDVDLLRTAIRVE